MTTCDNASPTMTAYFLLHAYEYINKRRPYEAWTLAILNEKRYDVLDAEDCKKRAQEIN